MYDYTYAKLAKNYDKTIEIENKYNIKKTTALDKSKINGVIKLEGASKLAAINDEMRKYVDQDNFTQSKFDEYANEFKLLLNTYSNVYEKLFIQRYNITASSDPVQKQFIVNYYVYTFKSTLLKKIIKKQLNNIVILEINNNQNEITESYIYNYLTTKYDKKSIPSKNIAYDIAFIVILMTSIRAKYSISSNNVRAHINQDISIYYMNDLDTGDLELYTLSKTDCTSLLGFIEKYITVINNVIKMFIPSYIIPELVVSELVIT